MQICSCTVRIGGSPVHTVQKDDVTPAEILVLQQIHGTDAVIEIKPLRMDKRSHPAEWDRLCERYGAAPEGLMNAGNGDLLEKMFPGAQKNLPIDLKDIGMGHLLNPNRAEEKADG